MRNIYSWPWGLRVLPGANVLKFFQQLYSAKMMVCRAAILSLFSEGSKNWQLPAVLEFGSFGCFVEVLKTVSLETPWTFALPGPKSSSHHVSVRGKAVRLRFPNPPSADVWQGFRCHNVPSDFWRSHWPPVSPSGTKRWYHHGFVRVDHTWAFWVPEIKVHNFIPIGKGDYDYERFIFK